MSATPGQFAGAVLLPPFGVYLKRGAGSEFWAAVALTAVAFVPGMVFALWSVLHDATAIRVDDPPSDDSRPEVGTAPAAT